MVKNIGNLVERSSFEESIVISDVVDEISRAIKKENPKFNKDEFYFRIFPEELAKRIALVQISRMAQEELRREVEEENESAAITQNTDQWRNDDK